MHHVRRLLHALRLWIERRDPAPWLGCGPVDAARRYWTGILSFRRVRASRAEFWWARAADVVVVWAAWTFVPLVTGVPNATGSDVAYQNTPGFLGIGQSVVGLVGSDAGWHLTVDGPPTQWVLSVWAVVTVVPNLALGARRLRDIGMPAWIAFFGSVPLLDWFLLLGALRRSWRPGPPAGPIDPAAGERVDATAR